MNIPPPPPGILETPFQAEIVRLARLFGWRVMHVNDSRKEVIDRKRGVSFLVGDEDAKGWPDLVLAHPRWHVFAVRELKTNKGRTSPAQREWLTLLTLCGIDAGEWRPRDWDEIVSFLTTRRRAARAA